jgi:hypothetical protein
MKARLTRWIFGLSLLLAMGVMYAPTPADAQVAVRVGPRHHRHYHHQYYRHHRSYR